MNTLKSFEDYYRQRAQLWEIQSLTRTRAIAGNSTIGVKFQKVAALLTNFKTPSHPLTAFVADWEKRINDMRLRIQNERTPKGKDELAIKTGKGGKHGCRIYCSGLCLRYGWQEANTLRALDRGARPRGYFPEPDLLIENYRRLRRLEGILRRWSYEGETVLPDDPAAYLRVAIRCGFSSAESFRVAVASWRAAIRDVYLKVFAA